MTHEGEIFAFLFHDLIVVWYTFLEQFALGQGNLDILFANF